MKVLISDGNQRAALAATRSLGRCAEVHVIADETPSVAGASRFATGSHVVPGALADPSAFRAEVAGLVARLGIDVVLPITDEACVALLPDPGAIAPARLLAPTWDVYRTLSDKRAVGERALRHGVALPEGAFAADVDAAIGVARDVGWPCILKPVASVVPATGEGRPARSGAVQVIDDESALRREWARDVGASGALVQRRVPGWGEGIFLLRSGGHTLAAFAHRRLREKPPGGGVSVLRESIAVDPDLLARIEAVLDEVGFDGVAMAEFKTDGRERWLMEFNVRLWGSLQLAIDAGVDFPRLLLEQVGSDGARPGTPPTPRIGVRSRWLLGELDHVLALARGRPDPHGRSGLAAAARVLLMPAGPACRWEVLRREDPAPFRVELRRWLRDLRGPTGRTAPTRARAADPSP